MQSSKGSNYRIIMNRLIKIIWIMLQQKNRGKEVPCLIIRSFDASMIQVILDLLVKKRRIRFGFKTDQIAHFLKEPHLTVCITPRT